MSKFSTKADGADSSIIFSSTPNPTTVTATIFVKGELKGTLSVGVLSPELAEKTIEIRDKIAAGLITEADLDW